MKMGADPTDRLYEELTDLTKVKNLLTDVRIRCVPLGVVCSCLKRNPPKPYCSKQLEQPWHSSRAFSSAVLKSS